MKIKIITPVHIGTGKEIAPFCYSVNEPESSKIYRYDDSELLAQIPYYVLANENLLNELRNEKSTKKMLYANIKKYVDYNKLHAEYELARESTEEIRVGVSELIKDCNKPYIPGSSMKGAFMTAWLYYFFKKNYKFLKEGLVSFIGFNQEKNYGKLKITVDQLLWVMYCECNKMKFYDKKTTPVFINNQTFSDLFKKISGCISCPDLYFEDMGLYATLRVGVGKEMTGEMDSLPMQECILPNQIITSEVITILDNELERIKQKYNSDKFITSLLTYVNKKSLLKACKEYYSDILEEERTQTYNNLYEDYQPINTQLEELQKISENSVLMRIGGSTNYFFKTISLLFKKNDAELYNEYFFELFFKATKKQREKVKAETMPKTRVVYYDDYSYLSPGYIEIIND